MASVHTGEQAAAVPSRPLRPVTVARDAAVSAWREKGEGRMRIGFEGDDAGVAGFVQAKRPDDRRI